MNIIGSMPSLGSTSEVTLRSAMCFLLPFYGLRQQNLLTLAGLKSLGAVTL